MNRLINAMVACGSGIATSTVAAGNIQEIFDELGVRVQLTKCSISDIPANSDGMDIILLRTITGEKSLVQSSMLLHL